MQASSFYSNFKKNATEISETEYVKTYELLYNEQKFVINITKKKANKLTSVKLNAREIIWIQKYRFRYLSPDDDVKVIFQPPILNCGEINVFVISGKVGCIEGLDSGIFRSAQFDCDARFFHVMSENAFKTVFLNT